MPASKRNTTALMAALVLTMLACTVLTLAAPARAYAALITSDSPVAAITGDTIYIVNPTNPTISNMSDTISDKRSDDGYLYMKKGKTTASCTFTYTKCGIMADGSFVDIVLDASWTTAGDGATLSAAADIYDADTGSFRYACNNTDGDNIRHGGAKINVTVHVYKTGTTTAQGGWFKFIIDDIDQPGRKKETTTENGKTTTKWVADWSSTYREGVELISGFGSNCAIGTSIGGSHKTLDVGTLNGHTWVAASHTCGENRCSQLVSLACNGATFAMYGSMGAGMFPGLATNSIPYTIRYNGNGNTSGTTADTNLSYNAYGNIRYNGFAKTGYTFNRWNRAANNTSTAYSQNQSVVNLTYVPGTVINLYAIWDPIKYYVAYNANGGTGTTATQTCYYDTAFNLQQNGFTRVGWKFTGWNTKADGTGTSYSPGQSVKNLSTTAEATVTLYAQWKSLMYAPDNAVRKVDSELYAYNGLLGAQGDATLSGAVFEFSLYPEVEGTVMTTPYAKANFTSTAGGLVPFANAAPSSGTWALRWENKNQVCQGVLEVREVSASTGYQLSSVVKRYRIDKNDNGTVTVKDTGDSSVVTFPLIYKEDVKRGRGGVSLTDADYTTKVHHGDATLSGSVYEVVSRSAQPIISRGVLYNYGDVVARITTDDEGNASTVDHSLPYGTYYLREVSASPGYVYAGHATTFTIRSHHQANISAFVDAVMRGKLVITLGDADMRAQTPQGDATLAGAVFEITNASAASAWVDGASKLANDTCKTIVTDASGTAVTDADSLPYGTYEVVQVAAPRGYKLTDETIRTFTIRSNGQVASLAGADGAFDEVIRGSTSGAKIDAETRAAGQGTVSVAGAEISAYVTSRNPVVVGGVAYTTGSKVMSVTTDAAGKYSFNGLPYGSYTICETAAPVGYSRNAGWSDSIQIRHPDIDVTVPSVLEDTVVHGGVSVAVVDADTMRPVPQGDAKLTGAVVDIVSDNDWEIRVGGKTVGKGQVACRVTTGASGVAATEADTLPRGSYLVRLSGASEGYVLSGDTATAAVTSEGVVVTASAALREKVVATPLTVHKIDSITRSSNIPGKMQNCQFGIYLARNSAHSVVVGGTEYAPGSRILGVVTDEWGYATTPYGMPYGSYYWREEVPPAGYNISDAEYPVYVRQDADGNAVERLP